MDEEGSGLFEGPALIRDITSVEAAAELLLGAVRRGFSRSAFSVEPITAN